MHIHRGSQYMMLSAFFCGFDCSRCQAANPNSYYRDSFFQFIRFLGSQFNNLAVPPYFHLGSKAWSIALLWHCGNLGRHPVLFYSTTHFTTQCYYTPLHCTYFCSSHRYFHGKRVYTPAAVDFLHTFVCGGDLDQWVFTHRCFLVCI